MSDEMHTPGPWQWERRSDGEVYLVHPRNGWLVVMDFARLGMAKGQPRFAVWSGDERGNMGGVMRPAKELDLSTHPDARLIAAAPDLLAALKALMNIQDVTTDCWCAEVGDPGTCEACRARQAISKAEGVTRE